MTDIVDSTRAAGRPGDAAWKQVLSDHNRLVRAQLLRFGGSEINTTGDGFLATFRSAVAGLRCAEAILDALRDTEVEVRIGVHTGEVEPIGNDIGGMAVHAAARIMALAGPSEVFASAMTVGLAEGSGLAFEAPGRARGQVPGAADRGVSARVTSLAASQACVLRPVWGSCSA
jgi:class 3 adenylate cyclase